MKSLQIFLEINWSCWLPILGWMLGAFILGWLLKHLFGGNNKMSTSLDTGTQHQAIITDLNSKYSALDKKHNEMQSSFSTTNADAGKLSAALLQIEDLKAQLNAANNKAPVEKIVEKIVEKRVEVPIAVTAAAPIAKDYKVIGDLFGARIIADDLKLVEGIGPKIEELFHAAGYKTWASVAATEPAKLKEVLTAAGERFQMHDPGTWPKQCQLMVDDKWAELKKYQDFLDGGKVPE